MRYTFNQLQAERRSIYTIGKNVALPQTELAALVKQTVREIPSSFNSQSSRIVILFDTEHEKLWDLVLDALREMLSADTFPKTESKINRNFKAGFGTILYFEDQDVVTGLQQQFSSYADNFPIWSEQSSGMTQYAVWLALTEAGLGATLQHYNPIIDQQIAKTWDIPQNWKLRAQMPFGSIEAATGEKSYIDDENRFKIFS